MPKVLPGLLTAALFSSVAAADSLEGLRWMSEEYPPYNYQDEDGSPSGIIYDVLMEMFDRLDVDVSADDIEFLPWARSYRIIQNEPGTALFGMTYTDEREEMFQFVGPIIPSSVNLLAPAESSLSVDSVEDMNELSIGVIREDIGQLLLRDLGVDESVMQETSNTESMLRMLIGGRVDAVAYAQDIAYWHLSRMGEDTTEYEDVYTLHESTMGFAFHRGVDDALIARLQATLEELQEEGFVQEISGEYLQ